MELLRKEKMILRRWASPVSVSLVTWNLKRQKTKQEKGHLFHHGFDTPQEIMASF
jgi:hypothetical protein